MINTTGMPLTLPPDFSIEIFADDLPSARVIVQDGMGNFLVSQPQEGTVSLLYMKDGEVVETNQIFQNLKRPHGLAMDPNDDLLLYVAEEDKIFRAHLYTDAPIEEIASLPLGGRHWTRVLGVGPDGRLYVTIGSTCDTCVEEDERHAAIHSMERDGSGFRADGVGLRNAVFFTWNPIDGKMWATEMGRDYLGDDLPPDEINIIERGDTDPPGPPSHYGWPWCYGKNVHDSVFDPEGEKKSFCEEEALSSYIDLPAHSSPLGLAFIPEEGWPEEYWYDLLVAYHGSWNKTEPTGYKIVRIPLDEEGNPEGEPQDFISGWLQSDGSALGRPVDLLVQPGGVLYVTDDKAGVVYRVTYQGE